MQVRDIIFIAFLVIALGIILGLLLQPLIRSRRRAGIMRRNFPREWQEILQDSFPLYAKLPSTIREKLNAKILVFLDEKQFIPCQGLVLTDEMKLLISAQACLLTANRPKDFYNKLRSILVYPAAFVAPSQQHVGSGMYVEGEDSLLGQSWQQGRVIVSWQDVQYGCQHSADGFNVSFHEFAHQLDQESGSANGAPVLERHLYEHWPEVLGKEYQSLQARVYNNQPGLIDEYGATHPAEFFAVVSELYLERPQDLQTHHPKLYQMLNSFYALDPHQW